MGWKCITKPPVGKAKFPKGHVPQYMISRAFIPPWSLVMTKPETLGPDTSRKEAGTLVSRYNLLEDSFTHLIQKYNKKLLEIFFRFASP